MRRTRKINTRFKCARKNAKPKPITNMWRKCGAPVVLRDPGRSPGGRAVVDIAGEGKTHEVSREKKTPDSNARFCRSKMLHQNRSKVHMRGRDV